MNEREPEIGVKIYWTAYEIQWAANTVAEASEADPRLRPLRAKLAWAARETVDRLRQERGAR